MVQSTQFDEDARIAALQRLNVLDTGVEAPFEHIVSLVRSVLQVPIVAVSLVDKDRQWFKAQRGLAVDETPRDVSFCSHAIEKAEPFIIPDAEKDPRFVDNALVTGEPGIRSYAGIPLRTADGYHVGALCVIDQKPRDFAPAEIDMLSHFAKIVERELELRQIADCDALTGVLTRRAFIERGNQEIARFQRYGRPSCLVLGDIDHFKSVNDTHGHVAGDAVLCRATALVMTTKRPVDIVGRLGGEEFAVLLPETDARAAMKAADRFRQMLSETDVALPGGQSIRVTASFGVAPLSERITSVELWLAAADVPLYAAKRAGRNRCECAS